MENSKTDQTISIERSVLINESSKFDFDLRTKVYQVLQSEGLINSDKIKVRVFDRTVYLDGVVASEKE